MPNNILLIQAHPDNHPHFNHALMDAYAQGAREAQQVVKIINIAELEIPFVRSQQEWLKERPVGDVLNAQELIAWADHIVLFFPLWLGDMPAKLKAFFEQTLRPDFVNAQPAGGLHNTSVRIVITMGMPALVYRWYFGAHGLKNLERNILKFCGAKPVRATLIGSVESLSEAKRKQWLDQFVTMGKYRR